MSAKQQEEKYWFVLMGGFEEHQWTAAGADELSVHKWFVA